MPRRSTCPTSNSVDAFFDAAEKHFGPVDILVNNAGVEAGAHTFVTLDDEGWDTVIDTNLKGLWWMTRELTRRVAAHKRAGAVVVNISSITSERTTKGIFPYAVSKAGVNQATRVMALEGAKYNVRVNALAPGYIYTNVSKALLDSDVAPEFVKRIPQRRLGEFTDLDGPLLLLASDASRYMTGFDRRRRRRPHGEFALRHNTQPTTAARESKLRLELARQVEP